MRHDLRTIFGCLTRPRRLELAMLILLMPVTALGEMLTVAAIVPFIALLSGQVTASSLGFFQPLLIRLGPADALWAAALLFGLLALVAAGLRLALFWTGRHFAFALGHEVSVEIQRRLLGQSYQYHLRRHSSAQLAALDKVELLVFDVVTQGAQGLSALLIGIFIFGLLVIIDPLSASLAILLIGGLYGMALVLIRQRLRSYAETINTAYEQRLKFVQESVGGIRDLILDQSQQAAVDRFRTVDAAFARARSMSAFFGAAPRFLIEAVGMIAIALFAIVISERAGGLALALPFLAALALGALRLLPLMSQLYGAWAGLAAAQPILADVAALLRLPIYDVSSTAAPVEFHRSIELDSVTFAYADRAHRAIEKIDLTISKGSRVAITGRTGSGKSTLADLLMGLIEPASGRILVDGVELSTELLPGWRQLIAHVPQEVFLADDSIAANIALSFHGGETNPERIRCAAESAQLHHFIESLPDGYDTRIGERGVRLSGGQRQRLALARAIYKQAPLLILDEATSALDSKTEAAVLSSLDELQAEGCTIIIIAHRMTTVQRCDRVFLLDEGQLTQEGSFAELSGRLVRLQDQGEL